MAEETKLKSQMSDGEAVKFSDEELQSLQGLQNTYASISTQFGQLKVSKMNLMRQLDSLEQSEETLESLKSLMTFIPLAGVVLSFILVYFYPIDSKFHKKLIREINERS